MSVTNDIFQTLRIENSHARWLTDHLKVAAGAFNVLYDRELSPDVREVEKLLSKIKGSTLARLWFDPEGKPGIETASDVLLYPEYTVWHRALRLIATPYDTFLGEYPCRASLAYAAYAEDYARCCGAEAALHTSSDGVVGGVCWTAWCGEGDRTGVGEWPLFCLQDGRAVSCSPMDSVWRTLGERALEKCGFGVVRTALTTQQMCGSAEVFIVTPIGVVSVAGLGEAVFIASAAGTIAAKLNTLI